MKGANLLTILILVGLVAGAIFGQTVLFGEMGRVHEGFDLHDLHTDMKTDVGFGVRMFMQGVIIRVDAAFGGEGAGLQVMIAQPF